MATASPVQQPQMPPTNDSTRNDMLLRSPLNQLVDSSNLNANVVNIIDMVNALRSLVQLNNAQTAVQDLGILQQQIEVVK